MSRHFPALRGLAILLVIVNHAITLTLGAVRDYDFPPVAGWERTFLLSLRESGVIAVPIFLFLSGYFAVYAMRGRGFAGSLRSVRTSLKHILIPYVLWSLVFYGVLYLLLGQVYSPIEYLKFLLTGYPFNFVPLLVAFYLISPLLVPAAGRAPGWTLTIIGAYQLFLLVVLAPEWLGFPVPAWTQWLIPPGLSLTIAIWGIFFPMGVVLSLHERRVVPWLKRLWPALAIGAFTLFLASTLDSLGRLRAPMAEVFMPVAAIPLLPLLRRDRIPLAVRLEQLGRNAYALYLTNLVLITLVLSAARSAAPGLFTRPTLLTVIAGFVAIAVPSLLAAALERSPRREVRVYLFG